MQTSAPITAPDRTVQSLRRRLERWELEHLRRHAAELADRLERAAAELEQAQDEAQRAWHMAEHWREEALSLAHELMEAGAVVGITQDGQIGVVASGEATGDRALLAAPQLLDAAQAAAELLARQKWNPADTFNPEAVVLAKLIAAISAATPAEGA